jgi:hypothetical protein
MYSGPGQALRQYSAGLRGGTSFVPSDVAGLLIWYKADALTGLVDGDPVASWPDSSGNSRTASQATGANQPTYKTNIVNSLPVVRFDATNDNLNTGMFTIGTTDWSFWAVVRNSDVTRAYLGIGAREAFNPAFYIDTSSPHMYWNGDYDWATALSNNTWYLLYWQRSGSNVTCYVNGVLDATTNVIADSFGNQAWIIGNQAVDSNRPFGGDIAEQGFYNSALSAGNRQNLEAYVSQKYGIF